MNFPCGNISKVGSVWGWNIAEYHPALTRKIGIENLDGADHHIRMRGRCTLGDPNNGLLPE